MYVVKPYSVKNNGHLDHGLLHHIGPLGMYILLNNMHLLIECLKTKHLIATLRVESELTLPPFRALPSNEADCGAWVARFMHTVVSFMAQEIG